jgi:hypothetical protein
VIRGLKNQRKSKGELLVLRLVLGIVLGKKQERRLSKA